MSDEIDTLQALFEWQHVAVPISHRRTRMFVRTPTVENQLTNCPVCGGAGPEYQFAIHGRRLMRCIACDLMFAVPFFSPVGCAALQGSFSDSDASLVNNLSENLSDRILAEGRAALIFASLP